MLDSLVVCLCHDIWRILCSTVPNTNVFSSNFAITLIHTIISRDYHVVVCWRFVVYSNQESNIGSDDAPWWGHPNKARQGVASHTMWALSQ